MSLLIAESGSTKTDWCLVREGYQDLRLTTDGLNPWVTTVEKTELILIKELTPYFDFDKVDTFYFYGAGLGSQSNRDRLNELFGNLFPDADIETATDILGIARSAYGCEPGIACILGTGSNACYYDGKKITFQVPSLGFILGDEGSGAYLGKMLLKSRYEHRLPDDIQIKFDQAFNFELAVILDRIYRQPQPNIFLAGFSRFISKNIDHPFIYTLTKQAFQDFFQQILFKIPDYRSHKIAIGGSIAYYFGDIIKQVAQSHDLSIEALIAAPIEGLIEFHKKSRK